MTMAQCVWGNKRNLVGDHGQVLLPTRSKVQSVTMATTIELWNSRVTQGFANAPSWGVQPALPFQHCPWVIFSR